MRIELSLLIALVCFMFLCSSKNRVYIVFIELLYVFRTANCKLIKDFNFWLDLICFFLIPISIGYIIFNNNITISDNVSGILATIFSLFFTLLFGVSTIIVGKIDNAKSSNKNKASVLDKKKLPKSALRARKLEELEKDLLRNTFVTIISTLVLSLFIMFICLLNLVIEDVFLNKVFAALIIAISLVIFMLILMIIKRTFVLVLDDTSL